MHYRELGRTGWKVSTISFGAWAIGGTWGQVNDDESMAALHRALDLGVNFFDTADVYGDGHSERLIARLRKERSEPFYVATKAGRRLSPHVAEGYTRENLTAFVERSLRNLDTDALDLLQLHCPPTPVYYMPEVFGVLDDLVRAGKLRHYGVSVEKVEEALKAIDFPGVQSVQIVYNIFRQRPAELLFRETLARRVGILARLPLSSGLLSGGLSRQTQFAADDHRSFNREGAAFDKGETFSGLDYASGLDAVEALRPLVPAGQTLAQFALRWILMQQAVTCAIPGGRRPAQIEENMRAADLPALSSATLQAVDAIYEKHAKAQVHHRW
ncbi:aldo/keto reductase [Rhizobacter sp. SG703]|uniref:aldo/keto reductase n=1 Tax=Rhizobacter sp. SG703 TaxID=2587140 RepID=UPI0014486122|nr:aldo/keto reductase [Rhizobacter sp. SG703]NKI94663.1 aryl-alcohol dehydrogenase-like predicted oxidoreductase [Rhizobacter sp. SG703]